MNIWMIGGLILTVAMILGLSIYSGTKFKAGGSKNGSAITAGIIMGTLWAARLPLVRRSWLIIMV